MNPILDNSKKALLAKVDKRLHGPINKIVESGQQLMYDEKTRHMTMKALAQTDPGAIGASFAGMTVMLFVQNKNLPMEALIPAGTLLLLDGLQFVEDAGKLKVTNDTLAAATKSFGAKLLELLQATPANMQSAVDKSHGSQATPAAGPAAAAPPEPAGGIVGGAAGAA